MKPMYLLTALLVLGACKDDPKKKKPTPEDTETGLVDTSPPLDTTDTSTDLFTPAYWSWVMYFGLSDGAFTDVYRQGVVWFPVIALQLAEADYPRSNNPESACYVYFSMVPMPGTSASSMVWFDWELDLTYLNTDCPALDPTIFGDNPGGFFASVEWEIAGGEPEARLLTQLEESGLGNLSPNLFGVDFYLDGRHWSADGDQNAYGFVARLDDALIVQEETYYDVADVADMPDGFYTLASAALWPLD